MGKNKNKRRNAAKASKPVEESKVEEIEVSCSQEVTTTEHVLETETSSAKQIVEVDKVIEVSPPDEKV